MLQTQRIRSHEEAQKDTKNESQKIARRTTANPFSGPEIFVTFRDFLWPLKCIG
jgi:hypothetical protein